VGGFPNCGRIDPKGPDASHNVSGSRAAASGVSAGGHVDSRNACKGVYGTDPARWQALQSTSAPPPRGLTVRQI